MMIKLTQQEENWKKVWEADIKTMTSRSTSKKLRNKTTKLKVLDVTKNQKMFAQTVLGKIRITRDLLQVNPQVREYLIAHELGHIEAGHDLQSTIAMCLIFTSIASAYYTIKSLYGFFSHRPPIPMDLIMLVQSCIFPLSFSLLSVFGLVSSFKWFKVDKYKMTPEWAADWHGARLLGKTAMIAGLQARSQMMGLDSQDFYKNKLDSLNLKNPPKDDRF